MLSLLNLWISCTCVFDMWIFVTLIWIDATDAWEQLNYFMMVIEDLHFILSTGAFRGCLQSLQKDIWCLSQSKVCSLLSFLLCLLTHGFYNLSLEFHIVRFWFCYCSKCSPLVDLLWLLATLDYYSFDNRAYLLCLGISLPGWVENLVILGKKMRTAIPLSWRRAMYCWWVPRAPVCCINSMCFTFFLFPFGSCVRTSWQGLQF